MVVLVCDTNATGEGQGGDEVVVWGTGTTYEGNFEGAEGPELAS